jgi:hypothetical protein
MYGFVSKYDTEGSDLGSFEFCAVHYSRGLCRHGRTSAAADQRVSERGVVELSTGLDNYLLCCCIRQLLTAWPLHSTTNGH